MNSFSGIVMDAYFLIIEHSKYKLPFVSAFLLFRLLVYISSKESSLLHESSEKAIFNTNKRMLTKVDSKLPAISNHACNKISLSVLPTFNHYATIQV